MGLITSVLPKSKCGDFIVADIKFLKWHRRLLWTNAIQRLSPQIEGF